MEHEIRFLRMFYRDQACRGLEYMAAQCGLSADEIRVGSHVAVGYTPAEIAYKLGLSQRAVKVHIRSLKTKIKLYKEPEEAADARNS